MNYIKYLEKEHALIIGVLKRVEEECINIVESSKVDIRFFLTFVNFTREFTHQVHHAKEEDILFRNMVEIIKGPAIDIINNGMMVEHQLSKYYITTLDENIAQYIEDKTPISKAQILANALSYVNLSRSHTRKENELVYPFSEKMFDDDAKIMIQESFDKYINSGDYERKQKRKEDLLKILMERRGQ
jgi:hemerythrin-like domain-containing protein